MTIFVGINCEKPTGLPLIYL